jgi:hypothetical protein
MFGTLGGDERIGSDRLPLALAPVPEFEGVAASGWASSLPSIMTWIAADAALAVEERRRENPRTMNLDLL